jgi:transposase-like protein
MTSTADTADVVVGRRDGRRQAAELYCTTSLSVAEIANRVGVTRASVYRWLRREGVALGRNANNGGPTEVREHLIRFSHDLAELRREQMTLIGQVRRLEGRIDALMGLKARAS